MDYVHVFVLRTLCFDEHGEIKSRNVAVKQSLLILLRLSIATAGAACIRCSKLSSTANMGARNESRKFFFSCSSGDWPPASRIPNVCTIADAINPGSLTDESETK